MVLAAFGHTVDDIQLKNDAFERNGIPSFKMKITRHKDAFRYLVTAGKGLDSTIKKFDALELLKSKDFDDSKQMFEVVSKHLYLMAEVCLVFTKHMNNRFV